MNATAIRSWWLAVKTDYIRPHPSPLPQEREKIAAASDVHTVSNRKSGEPEMDGQPGVASGRSDTNFWPDFSRQPDDAVSVVEPGRAVKPLNLLVPTDFAPESLLALDCALRMAAQQAARITLLHAIHLNLRPHGPANLERLKIELCREALAKAEPILLSARDRGVPAFCMLEDGTPAKAIAKAAKHCAPDLVIMANPRRGFFARLLSRNTVQKVVQSLHCPVLVLPVLDRPVRS